MAGQGMTRLKLSYGCALLACTLLATVLLPPGVVAVKSGGTSGSKGTTTTTTTTSSSSSRTTYGRSIGVTNRFRIVAAAALTVVYFNGFSYPAARFYYNGYYDDCALRNITAQQVGLNDSAIDNEVVIDKLPDLLASSNATADVVAFNQTLYTTTNGLIIDNAYCNYTSQYNGAGGARVSALLAVLLVAAAIWIVTATGGSGGDGGRGSGWPLGELL